MAEQQMTATRPSAADLHAPAGYKPGENRVCVLENGVLVQLRGNTLYAVTRSSSGPRVTELPLTGLVTFLDMEQARVQQDLEDRRMFVGTVFSLIGLALGLVLGILVGHA